jgi:glucose/arabinose dehydrogenase
MIKSRSFTSILLCIHLMAGAFGALACGDDDGGADAGGTAAGNGGMSGGSGGMSGGSGGTNGGGGGTSGGSGGNGGGGSGGSGGADGGSGGSGGSGEDAGGEDGGTDSGMPGDTFACVAPTPSVDFGGDCNAVDPVELALEPLRTDFADPVPIFLTHAPNDESRLFVAMRNGEVLILDPEDGSTIETFFDLGERVIAGADNNHNQEYGLLGFAFHPNYPDDPRIFVNYTTDAQADPPTAWNPIFDTVVSSFEASDSTNSVDMDSEQILVRFGQPQDNHNGGMLAFGKDNCLYIGAGDGGNFDDIGTGHSPGGNGQVLDIPLGKILRIDPDNPSERAPGNPAGPDYPHIWDHGVRNPWRFSFDRETGDLYIGDVGQGAFEEVSVAPRGVGDNNFGWPITEGLPCFGGGDSCNQDGLTAPASDYANVAGDNCVIGGYVYRGAAIPSLQGWYVYGDSGNMRRIRAFVWDGESECETPIILSERGDDLSVNARITSFGEDAAGELYVTTAAGVYRFREAE